MDRLSDIFKKQQELQDRLGVDTSSQDYRNVMTLAIIDEVMEALRENPWKPWKSQQTFNKEAYKEELVDVLHFFINLCLSAEMTPDELYERYMGKNKVNHKRQEDGY